MSIGIAQYRIVGQFRLEQTAEVYLVWPPAQVFWFNKHFDFEYKII